MSGPQRRRGPARDQASSKQRSDQAARTAANGTEPTADSARPGLYELLDRLRAQEKAARFPTWLGFCPFHQDRVHPNLCIEYKPIKIRELRDLEPWQVYVGCGICQGQLVAPPEPGETKGRKVNAQTVAEAVGLPTGIAFRNMDALADHVARGVPAANPPSSETIDGWHGELMLYSDLPQALYDRGLTEATVREYRIGWCRWRGRYSIPVWDEAGEIVGCRYWSPSAPKDGRYRGHSGCPVALYPRPPSPQRRGLIVCEGEFDCLLLRQHGFDAVTTTGGKGAWNDAWAKYFRGRRVAFLYDVGADSDAQRHAEALSGVARSTRVVDLGLPSEGDDVTDWFAKYGRSAAVLRELIESPRVAGGVR